MTPPTLADVEAQRRTVDGLYDAARRAMREGAWKRCERLVALALDAEQEADRAELAALRAELERRA